MGSAAPLLLNPKTLAVVGVLEGFERLEWVRRWRAVDTFELEINSQVQYATDLVKGRIVLVPEDDIPFLIEEVESVYGGHTDRITVSGRSLEGIALDGRLVIPRRGRKNDSSGRKKNTRVETAMKYFVRRHAGAKNKRAKRRIPNLHIKTDRGRGIKVRGVGRYQSILEVLEDLGAEANMGWEITTDLAAGKHYFDVIKGRDLTDKVYFDFGFDTLEEWTETVSDIERRTVVYVGGAGKGKKRLVKNYWLGGTQPKHLNRREGWLNASDVPRKKKKRLRRRGKKFLRRNRTETSVDSVINQFGSFEYREDWDLGDIVRIGSKARGVSYSSRIEEIRVTPQSVEVTLG